MSKRPVIIAEYSRKWPDHYREISGPLSEAFGEYARDIQHIGSTAIPGLSAKPIIDIAADLREYPLPESVISAVEGLGYTHRGEYGIKGRHYFVRYSTGADSLDVHVHAFCPGSAEWTKHVFFRDYLRAHPEAAREYERLKRNLAERYRNERETYTENKSGFVAEIVAKAEECLKQF